MRIILSVACFLGVCFARPQAEEIRPPLSSYLSCGKLFYRTVHMDEARNSLYVGAMDRVIKVNLNNVSETNCDSNSLLLEPSNVGSCVSKGKSENYDCRNHIRVITPIGDGEMLYVCGTNAHNPADLVVFANLTNPGSQHIPGIGSGIGKCPFDPEDNSTAIWVENGNPGGLAALYSGTNAEFTKADSVIFRTDLHNPNSGRRIAVEYMNCGKGIFSRIARVCKRDTGGKNILLQNWATYLKAKLNCSIPGEFPFYFNEIQSVYKIPDDDTKFYAVFTTGLNGLHGSAVCTFDLEAVHSAFNGKFKEQATSTSAWLPVPLSKVPEPRPGSCVEDTRELPDRVLNFMRSHPLMDDEVDHEGGEPVFYKRNVVFTHLVVDKISTGRKYICALAMNSIYLSIQGTVEGEPIRAMEISRRKRMLYITSDNGIRQINLNMCSARYESCLQCSLDPMCGWDRERGVCSGYTSTLLSDPTRSKDGLCDSSIFKRKLIANFGQSIHLSCSVGKSAVTSDSGVEWHHYSKTKGRYRVELRTEKHVLTNDNGLVVISVSDQDSGRCTPH
ncbi:semaphorin-2A [Eurytemora carolleeae]|uniref:semaphorin-2A n=1 Tax=Eurytemora carolleeae TaxID=1294199 RepID=UPI000C76C8F3|nr:semaphorin-2A [Eurytemora carolleeae]|eukprot:XP_023340558.1 semaphorin-2A-like [Eurytemora affinis]